MNERNKNLVVWAIIVLIFITLVNGFTDSGMGLKKLSYTSFLKEVNEETVDTVMIDQQVVTGQLKNGERFSTYLPLEDQALLDLLYRKNIDISGKPPEQRGVLFQIFINWFPFILFALIWLYMMRQMQGGGSGKGPLTFGRSRARMTTGNENKITFKDVAGVDEAKEEVQEFVDFLKDPGKFSKLGGKIPCGALLVGSPGTGKTLLAKAVAGEADVPFFTISGSDFVEMFVGVGASRVRDMFEQAKKQAPCIIFIDEIDAVGRHRGAGLGGGHDEREQTLNQLLVEMDGFEGKEGVIVMAATNRPDVLDPALLRPGRFDRQVVVPLPDIKGRCQILEVHIKKIVCAQDVEPEVIARGTPGFSGADLANLVNEAALFAARSNKRMVSMHEFEKAKDKILMGVERNSAVMDDAEKLKTAYHESGHTIVGLLVPNHDPVYKVSIIPRGRALGVTMYLPEKDQYSLTFEQIESRMQAMYGGRIAEELIYGYRNITTGAQNDIEKATELARKTVTVWGLSEVMGPINFGSGEEEVFLGKSMSKTSHISGQTANMIDEEIKKLVDRNYKAATELLKNNLPKLHAMADALMKYETINKDQIERIMKGESIVDAQESSLDPSIIKKSAIRKRKTPKKDEASE
ncbi:MAG: ATP-dependent zinc metalloprotease FtsH [Gammaproteobacteria bacterium]|jgi:cell division protease FtsH|nr:ATP-dependent zinc metalloprotease FtsH [Gammaproteobacteria bacterium]